MPRIESLSGIRQEYGDDALLEDDVPNDPISQFEKWFQEHLLLETITPNAMVVSTVDDHGVPDSRIVLLKELDNGEFIFYTNYYSTKGKQLEHNPNVALNFFWPAQMRQVRVRGQVKRVSRQQSEDYFQSRPQASKLSAIVSIQSTVIDSRQELEEAIAKLSKEVADNSIKCPDFWGGYAVKPIEFEFWQGRNDRLHDRIQYYREKDKWRHQRLAP